MPIAAVRPGDVFVFNLDLDAGHLGVRAEHPECRVPSVIHAYAPRRRVVEEPLVLLDGVPGALTGAFRPRTA